MVASPLLEFSDDDDYQPKPGGNGLIFVMYGRSVLSRRQDTIVPGGRPRRQPAMRRRITPHA
jgi:hypothetical protein